jgi:anti-sigma regulatory factor (Ser/Thr protein kinase)
MTTDIATHSMCCRLRREPAQVRQARKQVCEALSQWGLDEHADLAQLIVGELAANAIRHGDGIVHVCVSFTRCDLRVEVHDEAASRSPVRRRAAADDESGRGLALLDGLIGLHGGRRGVAYDSTGHCKAVYVVICLATDPVSPVTRTSAGCADAAGPVTAVSASSTDAVGPGTGAPASCAATAHRHDPGKPGLGTRPDAAASCAAAYCLARRPVVCQHSPRCPGADAPDRQAARVIAFHPEQGWSLLCNGVVVFEDNGALLPDGTIIRTHCAAARPSAAGLLPNPARPRGAPCRTDALVRGPRRTDATARPGAALASPTPRQVACPAPHGLARPHGLESPIPRLVASTPCSEGPGRSPP